MHFDKGANVLHLFSVGGVGGHMSSYVNCLGGRCPHMPFFIGGHMSGGGENVLVRKCSYLHHRYLVGLAFIPRHEPLFVMYVC